MLAASTAAELLIWDANSRELKTSLANSRQVPRPAERFRLSLI